MEMIYLDNAATTQPLQELQEVYSVYAQDAWQNPSALYAPAVNVQKQIARAKETLLEAFSSTAHKCFFTSGGTEGANTVILRGARHKKNMNFVCGGAEHPCVEESFKFLEAQGHPVVYVRPDSHGVIRAQDVASVVDENTALVSIMHVNNETGAKNNIESIAAAVKAKNREALFHADGVQAYLREEVGNTQNIDYYTVSAHKVHAHKGTGAVFYRNGTPLKAYLLGGGQENGLRSGTQNTLGILCFARAADYFMEHKNSIRPRLLQLNEVFMNACSDMEGVHIITPQEQESACGHIINIAFEDVAGETLLHTLEGAGIYISTGSACSSKKGKSRIAQALGLPETIAGGAVRISFSIHNTKEDCIAAVHEIRKNIALLRRFKRV